MAASVTKHVGSFKDLFRANTKRLEGQVESPT